MHVEFDFEQITWGEGEFHILNNFDLSTDIYLL